MLPAGTVHVIFCRDPDLPPATFVIG